MAEASEMEEKSLTQESHGGLLAELEGLRTHCGELEAQARQHARTAEEVKGRNRVLERLAAGASLDEVLSILVESAEASRPGMLCSVLLLEAEAGRLCHGAAPSLPDFYNEAIDGIEIGPGVGSCGSAAATGERVVVADIRTHPNWRDYRELAEKAGLRASWSEPVVAASGEILGTFAMYYREPRRPSEEDLEFIKTTAHVAGIAIERKRTEDEHRSLEAQVQQAQKLESLGVLVGGIAHDFNNLLVGMLGNAELVLSGLAEGTPEHQAVSEIEKAASRAAELTHQMLAYAGRASFEVKPVRLNALIEEMKPLLASMISKKALVRYRLGEDFPLLEGDPSQLRQVVMNLIINAAEALEEKEGLVRVKTGVTEISGDQLRKAYLAEDLPAGPYAYLRVSDNGSGMDEETRNRIFDPFYTTKFAGRGLGLAAVLGIVKSHHGAIRVETAAEKGTTFTLYFPIVEVTGELEDTGPVVQSDWRGSGTVLVVDDEPTVRGVVTTVLERMGFTTLEAVDGREGLETFRRHAEEIRAVLLDMTMPRLDGGEAFREIHRLRPDTPVILLSGYTEEEAARRFHGSGLAGFVHKPFRPRMLIEKLRQILEAA